MKMFLTRLGFGSQIVVTGDVTQIDLPRGERSGLIEVGEILSEIDDVAFVRFDGGDVVRHKLVQHIVSAYAEHAELLESQRKSRKKPRRQGTGDDDL
jgi:phosphate starvation-inducible PhoH-like protein